MSEISTPTNNMRRWSAALPAESELLRKQLFRPRDESIRTLRELNVPHCEMYIAPAVDFYDMNEIPDIIQSDMTWWQVYSTARDGHKTTTLNIPRKDAFTSICRHIATLDNPQEYLALIGEFYENDYGGNIVVTPENEIVVEFGAGNQGEYAAGEKTPYHIAVFNPFLRSMKYNFTNEELRKSIWHTVSALRDKSSFDKFTPGYYEFILHKNSTGKLQTVFIDARTARSPFNDLGSSVHSRFEYV